ncbi:MFS transporter [Cupriavidus pauculus]|uniref:MFS transporter n=1 Tax=Cupriavidus pauculus TaxID=82633 RepID=A0A2N5C7C9_9BURK|nr:MFS transporter [Cupriavidus pauculus]PLP98097.1 MFS transporter [Cupriavidus pauculus]
MTSHTVPLSVPPARRLTPSHRWKVLGVGVAANASVLAAVSGLPATAVWMRTGYQLDTAQVGLAVGAIGLGTALSELPWGLAADRWGDRPVLLGGLAATSAALLVMALWLAPALGPASHIPPLSWLVMAMTLVGLVGGSVNGASGRAVMRWFHEGERGLAMSIRQTAVPMGGGIGALTLPWLASTWGFAWAYGWVALLCAVSAVLTWCWLHEPPDFQATSAAPLRSPNPLGRASVWRIVLAIGLLCVPQFAVLTFASIFLHDYAHAGLGAITATLVTIQAGAMATRVWSGRWTDRHGNRRAYLRSCTLITVVAFLLLAAFVQGSATDARLMALLPVALALAGIAVSAWHGVGYTELAAMAGADRAGTALGMANTVVFFGFFLTPLALPHWLALTSWPVVWATTAVVALGVWPLFPRPSAR